MKNDTTARDIAEGIKAKAGAAARQDGRGEARTHLASIRYWLAFGREHPAPNGETHRIRQYHGHTMLMCWTPDLGWFPARQMGAN